MLDLERAERERDLRREVISIVRGGVIAYCVHANVLSFGPRFAPWPFSFCAQIFCYRGSRWHLVADKSGQQLPS
jgi:hypothetical protein